MNYPLITSYPLKRQNPVSGEDYPVTSELPAHRNVHKPATASGPVPVSRQRQPSTGHPNHKIHSLKRPISRPAIHLPPNSPACVPSRR